MDRRIKATKKSRDGKIVALCNPGQSWSPRKTTEVIGDISSNKRSYYVQEADRRIYVRVVDGALRTTADKTSGNHLDALPSG